MNFRPLPIAVFRAILPSMVVRTEYPDMASAQAPESLHHTVIGMEQTRLSFELMLAVRNKTLDAYQELMRMQV